ncbi:M48 family metalloprotease [Phytoactinopolyspora halotolerans]|uniref:M48 family metalloprotease n=1 Tax=Phytoactinopolyspora halotolerans TaxID=1981512 RepID=A0A6L9SAW8_9ACTN|nr:M48 family metalloprotease [Phytoactinopolyspora halotolerans]NEE02406.1 M48 family metalloprotease [Phytoactinopolyspora halotolerans]
MDEDVAIRWLWPVLLAWLVILVVSTGYAVLACWVAWAMGLPWWLGLLLPAITLVGAESIRWMVKGGPLGVDPVRCGPEDQPTLHAILDRLCAVAGQDKPEVRIIDIDAPNSLVYVEPGKRPTLCVTKGLVETLDNDRLEAVLAHEIAHIAHRDTRVMAFAEGMAGWAVLLPGAIFMLMGRLDVRMCAAARACGRSWRPSFVEMEKSGLPTTAPVAEVTGGAATRRLVALGFGRAANAVAAMFVIIPAIVLGVLVAAPAFVLSTPLARRRELAADRTAARITGAPATLAAALVEMSGAQQRVPDEDLRARRLASALAIVPFDASVEIDGTPQKQGGAARMFEPHPSMKARLAQLERMSRELGTDS